ISLVHAAARLHAWRECTLLPYSKYRKGPTQGNKNDRRIQFLNYEDRLVRTGLTTLEERRTREVLIEAFKMIEGLNKSDYTRFFTIVQNNRTRGHKLKIVKTRSRLNIRKNFFSQRVVNDWNALPVIVVESESVNSFKNNYDKYAVNKINE